MGKEKPVEGKFVTSVKVGPKGQIIPNIQYHE